MNINETETEMRKRQVKKDLQDFPGGTEDKKPPASVWSGKILVRDFPGQEDLVRPDQSLVWEDSHAMEQLSPCTTMTKPTI